MVNVRIVKQLIVESAVIAWTKGNLGDQNILKSVVFRDGVNLLPPEALTIVMKNRT